MAVDAYRHDHGADAAALISRGNPGMLVALAGLSLAAAALLVALSMVALADAVTPRDVFARGAGVMAAWTAVGAAGVAGVVYAATSELSIGHAGHTASTGAIATPARTASPTAAASGRAPTVTPAPIAGVVTLRGAATVDGKPLQTPFLGARVVRDGLLAACQGAIPGVNTGRYEIPVLPDSEARGCGAPGARIVLWASVDNRILYSRESAPWPEGGSAEFDATFSTTEPSPNDVAVTEFFGHVVLGGQPVPDGPVVQALIGTTLCGVAQVRRENEDAFVMIVAGPQVPGCTQGGRIDFIVDGAAARETAVHDLGRGQQAHEITLTLP